MLLLTVPAWLNWTTWQKLWRKDSHILLIHFPHSGAPLLLTTLQNPFPPRRKIGCVQLLTPQLLCSAFGMSTVWSLSAPRYLPALHPQLQPRHFVLIHAAYSLLPKYLEHHHKASDFLVWVLFAAPFTIVISSVSYPARDPNWIHFCLHLTTYMHLCEQD